MTTVDEPEKQREVPALQHVTMLGVWGARRETAAQLATRLRTLLAAVGDVLGARNWVTGEEQTYPSQGADQAALIERYVGRDAHDDPDPDGGYSLVIVGNGPVDVVVNIIAGCAYARHRQPANRVLIGLNAETSIPGHRLAEVFEAVVSAWAPSSAALRDDGVTAASRGRGGCAPLVGYLTWISCAIGRLASVPPGLLVSERVGGSMIWAPADWSIERVVGAVLSAVQDNGVGTAQRGT